MHLSFASTDAAEMLLRANQGAQIALKIVDISGGEVVARMVVMLNGAELMFGDDLIRARIADTIILPAALDVQFTTA